MSEPNYPTIMELNNIYAIFRAGWMNADVGIINAFGKGSSKATQSDALSSYVNRHFSRGFDAKLVRRVLIYAANNGFLNVSINRAGYKAFSLTKKGRSQSPICDSHTKLKLSDFKLDLRPHIVVETTKEVELVMPKMRPAAKGRYTCPGRELSLCDQKCATCLLEPSNFHDVLPGTTITKEVKTSEKLMIPRVL